MPTLTFPLSIPKGGGTVDVKLISINGKSVQLISNEEVVEGVCNDNSF